MPDLKKVQVSSRGPGYLKKFNVWKICMNLYFVAIFVAFLNVVHRPLNTQGLKIIAV